MDKANNAYKNQLNRLFCFFVQKNNVGGVSFILNIWQSENLRFL